MYPSSVCGSIYTRLWFILMGTTVLSIQPIVHKCDWLKVDHVERFISSYILFLDQYRFETGEQLT